MRRIPSPIRSRSRRVRLAAPALILVLAGLLAGCPKNDERLAQDMAAPDPSERLAAAAQLAHGIGDGERQVSPQTAEQMLPILLGEAKSPVAANRAKAFEALARWAPKLPESAAPTLFAGLDDGDSWARAHALAACYRQYKHTPTFKQHEARWNAARKLVIPDLKRALADPDAGVRLRATRVVTDLESNARELLPDMQALARDPDAAIRGQAVSAIEQSGLENQVSVEEWLTFCKDPAWQVRQPAASALARIGASTVPRLVEVLRSEPNDEGRSCAVSALGQLGPAAKEALPALREAAENDSSYFVRRQAASAAERVEGRPPRPD
ncbi:MAG: HEAT repeat domain-containing protein [Deltaproteobacteria bacterium]|nr:HEAT repeat domain-containing protein [Deltaproteobacteria bacterium]